MRDLTMSIDDFRDARDFLLALRTDYSTAKAKFAWPKFDSFNWALDWFDGELAAGEHGARPALTLLGEPTESYSFAELSEASSRVANALRTLGAERGDRLLLMLGNVAQLWIALLAAMKLGLVVIPAPPQLAAADLDERLSRGRVRLVVAEAAAAAKFEGRGDGLLACVAVGGAPTGWRDWAELMRASPHFEADAPTRPSDPLLLYFTSGATAQPKLVLHTHASYPVGHLTTMYGLGLQPGDMHLNISSPGWAKHAWSNVFAPWNAGATAVALTGRFEARAVLDHLAALPITSFCAPPTVWRQFIQLDFGQWKVALREICSSGEPLNPDVIEKARRAWGLTLRDCYGQTETTMMVGNPPGQKLVVGAMGRPLPGYRVVLLDVEGLESDYGEIALPLSAQPLGLTPGYLDDDGALQAIEGEHFRTGDIASRDGEGFLTYVGRADDLFKSSDYRLSPFELESALLEHPLVAEAAVAPARDPIRLTVPKAYVTLAKSDDGDRAAALSLFSFLRDRLAPYKRIRRIEFVAELPKTLSGKIRRVVLRQREADLAEVGARAEREFRIEDFPELG
jgi:acetyl-CoA synthetase